MFRPCATSPVFTSCRLPKREKTLHSPDSLRSDRVRASARYSFAPRLLRYFLYPFPRFIQLLCSRLNPA